MITKFYDVLLDGLNGGEIKVTIIDCVPYQKCPICEGSGYTLSDWYTSSIYQPCPTCNGMRIIPMFPIKQKEAK
jgi:DnaJ-class molecular chaperone